MSNRTVRSRPPGDRVGRTDVPRDLPFAARQASSFEGEVVVVDGRIAFCSRSYARMTGRTVRGLRSFSPAQWQATIHPEDRPRALRLYGEAMQGGPAPADSECRILKPDGAMVWIRTHVDMIDREGRRALRLTCVDITPQKQMEEGFRNLVEHSLQGLIILQDHRIVYANPAYCELSGYAAEELCALPPLGFRRTISAEDRGPTMRRYRDRLAGLAPPRSYEARLVRKDGRVRWVEVYSCATTFLGRPAVQVAFVDITERRHAVDALQESENNFRAVAENAGVGILVRSSEGQAVYVNRQASRMLGYSRRELLAMRLTDVMSSAEARRVAAFIRRRIEGREAPSRYEAILRRKDGREIRVEISASRTFWKGLPSSMAVLNDVTEIRRLEEELYKISVIERQKIGQDIHDSLCQDLAGVAYLSQSLAQRFRPAGGEEAAAAEQIAGTLGRALRQVRNLSRGLVAFSLSEEGFVSALRRLADESSRRYATPCRFRCRAAFPLEDEVMATHLYHIAEEAVSNAMRHARPTAVSVSLSLGRSGGHLTVVDDGRGMPKSTGRQSGLGLRIMRHRAEMIGGELTVRSARGKGTSVRCSFPLRASGGPRAHAGEPMGATTIPGR